MKQSNHGAWIPWPLVERVQKLRLRLASRWQVLFTILAVSCRYGGKEARLSVREIAARTGLSERTVKAALADLIHEGHVRRVGRYGKLVVTLMPAPLETELPLPR